MDRTPPAAFANRYTCSIVFNGVSTKDLDSFFDNIAGFLAAVVIDHLVLSYDEVRYEEINKVVSRAHSITAVELRKQSLFQMQRFNIDNEWCYADDSLFYLVDENAPVDERITYLEYFLMLCARRLQHQWHIIEGRVNWLLKASSIHLEYRDLYFRPMTAGLVRGDKS
ncbi:hypothetical protein [Methylobacterium nodulans]|nr:hypothetical protein [Methylobacterium nodulans]